MSPNKTVMEKISNLPYCDGPFDAKVAFIGEAAGKDEAGDEPFYRPFIGASGQLLRKWMRWKGINDKKVYITNVLKHRPPYNDIATFARNNPGTMKQHLEVLKVELSLLKECNLFVLLGNVPLRAVTGLKGITARRGSVILSKKGFLPNGKQVKCIPVVHPAGIMYNWKHFAPTLKDLERVAYDMHFPELRTPEREYIIRPSFNEATDFLYDLLNDTEPARSAADRGNSVLEPHNVISVDTETKEQGRIATIQFCNNSKTALCIPFQYGSGKSYWPVDQEVMLWRMIGRVLHERNLVGQNFLMYDSYVLGIQGFDMKKILDNVYIDTMEAFQCYQPDMAKGLGYLTSLYTREPYYKAEGKEGIKDWSPTVSEEQFWTYGCKDVLVVHEMFPEIQQDLERHKLWNFYLKFYQGMAPLRLALTRRGLLMDKDTHAQIKKDTFRKILKYQSELTMYAGRNVNVRSAPQMKKLLYEDMKLPKQYLGKGKKKRVTCNEDAIVKLAAESKEPSEILNLILKVRHHRTRWSNYIKVKTDSDNRVRASYGFTETGRFTSYKNPCRTGYNLQNWPRDMRNMIRTDDEDHIFIEMDLAQAESRVVAWRSRDEKLMNAYLTGVDMHSRTASNLFNVHIDDVKYAQRYTGKRVNHAANYDMHGMRFAQVYNKDAADNKVALISIDRANKMLALHHQETPSIKQVYHRELFAEMMQNKKQMFNLWGRRMVFQGRIDNELRRKLYAWYAQSTVGDLTNEIFRRVHDRIRIVNQNHDSLLAHVRIVDMMEAMKIMKEAAQIPLQIEGREILIPVDFKIGMHWGKAMEEVKYEEIAV